MNTDDVFRDWRGPSLKLPATESAARPLAAASRRDGILDVAYRIVDSPVGPLRLAAS